MGNTGCGRDHRRHGSRWLTLHAPSRRAWFTSAFQLPSGWARGQIDGVHGDRPCPSDGVFLRCCLRSELQWRSSFKALQLSLRFSDQLLAPILPRLACSSASTSRRVLSWQCPGAIGNRYGDKAVVLVGLALMTCGDLTMAFSSAWALQIGGRLLAGVGGVLLNVLMSKMVTDWFADKEIATAMGIFVNSWIVGIALALVVLPPIAVRDGISSAFIVVTVLVIVSMAVLAVYYRAPPSSQPVDPAERKKPAGAALLAVIVAGLMWGQYRHDLQLRAIDARRT
jgi:hypothetical protein